MNHFPGPDEIEPYGSRLLVKKYTKPDKIGSIYVNPAWKQDNSRALWELVKMSPGAEKYLGLKMPVGSIIITLPNRGVHFPTLGEDFEYYFLFAEEVVKWIQKDWTD